MSNRNQTKQIKKWMKDNSADHMDDCGELNLTGLAESAAAHFEMYGPAPDHKIPEFIFDLASDLAY